MRAATRPQSKGRAKGFVLYGGIHDAMRLLYRHIPLTVGAIAHRLSSGFDPIFCGVRWEFAVLISPLHCCAAKSQASAGAWVASKSEANAGRTRGRLHAETHSAKGRWHAALLGLAGTRAARPDTLDEVKKSGELAKLQEKWFGGTMDTPDTVPEVLP